MFKKFKVWLEEKKSRTELRKALLDRLGGLEGENRENEELKLSIFRPSRLMAAIDNLGIVSEEGKKKMKDFIRDRTQSKEADIDELLDQVDDLDITPRNTPEIPSEPAEIPAGQPQPPPMQQQAGMQPMM